MEYLEMNADQILQTTYFTIKPGSTIMVPELFKLIKTARMTINVSAVQGHAQNRGRKDALQAIGNEFGFAIRVVLKDDLKDYEE